MPSPGISLGDLMVLIAVVLIVAIFLLVVRAFIKRVETPGHEGPSLAGTASPRSRFLEHVCRILPAAAFCILSGLCGIGITWLPLRILESTSTQSAAERLMAESLPILFAGGAFGALVGVVVAFRVLKMEPSRAQTITERYVGAGAVAAVYLVGFTAFIILLLAPLLRWLGGIVGQNTDVYVDLGVGIAVTALSVALYYRIPKRFLIPLAVIVWMFILSMAVWYFFFGPGAFEHS